ncbi:uncharacterized protein LOC112680298 isoform X2 [Sipha flava]|uniref:Uncharacterized protein LOC112680298 isoform X2 n=1 Tax=Sipha flava TaxID=143950 RepID=A0A8B8F5P4_9HEMI|nr:uncharacterized protein LOC112680298 isoform X2 [Sipha flava]
MSSTNSDDSNAEKSFDWNKYLIVRNAEKVPEEFFHHVCKSELNGIEVGSVVEIENEDQNGYWFASVCSSKGVLINLHYFGDENDKHDFWLEVKSPRIHSLNWGSENNKKLVPPYPNRFSRVNLKTMKEKVQDCENIVSNYVLQMNGVPIHNIFKPEMFVEVQDKEYPYRVWISKILKNVGGRLFLKMQGVSSPEKTPFWLFYLNERIFPLGWAEQKGLPWRVMNLDVKFEDILDSSFLMNVLKPKTPEQHSYKVGEMLEVINPYSLMVFYVATIVKIYDNRYFKVEVDNDSNIQKRITFIATKENPYLFNGGWASKHKFLLKPPSDWNTSNTFCWSKYISMKNSKLANINNICRKKTDCIRVGMKLEAVDPMETNRIRVATVKGLSDHWMILSFDRTHWCDELLHVRSVYSDDVFPVGWCNKHKYLLSTPKVPFADCDDYKNMYYASDIDIDFHLVDKDYLEKYPNFVKGEIFYHYSKKNSHRFEDKLEESIQNILNEDCVNNSIVSKTADKKLNNIKVEPPELDEELHDAILQEEVGEKDDFEKKKNYGSKMCIYFNKNCYSGKNLLKKKTLKLPKVIGPGPVSTTLKHGISLLINCNYYPGTALKKLKNIENILFNGPGGVNMLITSKATKSYSKSSQNLLLPDLKNMAQSYCSTLCSLSGMCENFMTTEQMECPNCKVKDKLCSKLNIDNRETMSNCMNATEIKIKPSVSINSDYPEKHLTFNDKTAKIGSKSKTRSKKTTKGKGKSSVYKNSGYSEISLFLNEEIHPVDSTPKLKIDTEPSSTKVTRKRAKPSVSFNSNSSQNNLILNEEISPVETNPRSIKVVRKRTKSAASMASKDHFTINEKIVKTFETDPSAIKVPRKKAKLSVSSNSSSSQNNLTLNEEIQQVGTKTNLKIDTLETEPKNKKVSRKKANPMVSIDSDYSEDQLTLNEEIIKIFETKPNPLQFTRKRSSSAAAFYSDCLEKRFIINEENPYLFDTVDTEEISMKITEEKDKSPIPIDSECTENWFNPNVKFNKIFKTKPKSMKVSRRRAESIISIDSDNSVNENEELNRFETKPRYIKYGIKRATSSISIDSDSSDDQFLLNDEIYKILESKSNGEKFDRKRANAAFYSDYFNSYSTLNEITEYDSESKSCIEIAPNSMKFINVDLENCESRLTLKQEITKVAVDELDWSNTPLVERYYYYLGCIINYEAHMIRLDRSYTELEISIISEIQSKKSYLSMLDEIDTYSNTKSDIDRSDQEIIIYNEWYC